VTGGGKGASGPTLPPAQFASRTEKAPLRRRLQVPRVLDADRDPGSTIRLLAAQCLYVGFGPFATFVFLFFWTFARVTAGAFFNLIWL
jgi:hypothetical protein